MKLCTNEDATLRLTGVFSVLVTIRMAVVGLEDLYRSRGACMYGRLSWDLAGSGSVGGADARMPGAAGGARAVGQPKAARQRYVSSVPWQEPDSLMRCPQCVLQHHGGV